MARYAVAAVILLAYIGGSTLIVKSAGRSYRENLEASRQAALTRKPEAVAKEAEATRAQATEPADPPAKAVAVATPTPAPDAATRPEPTPSPTPKPAPVVAAKGAEPEKPGAKPEPPDPALAWADGLDLAKISESDETRLGRELHRMILSYNKRDDSGHWDQRIDRVARPILETRTRKGIEYTFTILDSEAVNAFSTPGGFVYLSRGLFNLIGEDEDYALEFVIGHEVAHVDLKHAIACVAAANAEEKKHGMGTLPQFYLLIAFGYPDKQVYEADAWAFRRMTRELDRSRHDTLAFLRKFENYAALNKFKSGRQLPPQPSTPEPGAVEAPPSFLENHYRAETAAWKRLNELKSQGTNAGSGLLQETPKSPAAR
ncbi:M48 family metalloprotease [Singulisphaera sp. PoT]|uniref:M48 family metalloprotease n=1 Tax=Singulisphaera sp. PoT TaxID=3411797 RepID=UPI003BF504F1